MSNVTRQAAAIIRAAQSVPCQPWPRHVLAVAEWQAMAAALAAAPDLVLLALWADAQAVHALFHDRPAQAFLPASVVVAAGSYPALSPHRPEAAWFERAIHDLWGFRADGGRDLRPWLDHGAWEHAAPLAARPPVERPLARSSPLLHSAASMPLAFLDPYGEDADEIPIGPLAPDIAAAGLFRVAVHGSTVAGLELRLGYLHKGILALMRGKSPRAAARFAARLAGAATVAHSIAFAHAAEAASDAMAPPRAAALRAVMAEAERIAIQLADSAAICRAAGAPLPAGRLLWHREAMLRAAALAFGHRLMMDVVIPGGVAADIAPGGADALAAAAAILSLELPELEQLSAGGLAARLAGIGVVAARLASDARSVPGYPPYGELNLATPVRQGGDVAARLAVRLDALRQSCRLLRTVLADLPPGGLAATLPLVSAEGIGWAEGPRGGIWHWLRLEGGQIAAAFLCDPSWHHIPLLEAAMRGSDLADLDLVRHSFGLSHAGIDM